MIFFSINGKQKRNMLLFFFLFFFWYFILFIHSVFFSSSNNNTNCNNNKWLISKQCLENVTVFEIFVIVQKKYILFQQRHSSHISHQKWINSSKRKGISNEIITRKREENFTFLIELINFVLYNKKLTIRDEILKYSRATWKIFQ